MSTSTIEIKHKKAATTETGSNSRISFQEQKLNKMRSILKASPVPVELLRKDTQE
ncbi:MAG: hypothetical protein ABIN80_12730 [Dyadobacter sp.]|uniref:hypothetical protein n=1 Tax=Dyadobacter sp. TaxID=1914288 RepID=UPI0032640085